MEAAEAEGGPSLHQPLRPLELQPVVLPAPCVHVVGGGVGGGGGGGCSCANMLLQRLPALLATGSSEAELVTTYGRRPKLGEAVLVHFQARRAAGNGGGAGAGNGQGGGAGSVLLKSRNIFFHASSSASAAAAAANASAQAAQAALSATLTPSTLDWLGEGARAAAADGGDLAGRIGLPGQGAPMRFVLGAGEVVLQVDLLVRGMFKGEVATMLCREEGPALARRKPPLALWELQLVDFGTHV